MNEVVETKPEINPSAKHPVYIWDTGRMVLLKKKWKVVADKYLENFSIEDARVEVNKQILADYGKSVIAKWLHIPEVRIYIYEKLKDRGYYNGWTKEKWVGLMTEHVLGKRRMKKEDLYCMKLIADILGWDTGELNTNAVQINFTQGDGRS